MSERLRVTDPLRAHIPHRFVLQLISLAGLHLNALTTAELAARFKTDGMLAYVDMIQKREKEIGCDVLTHQKWYVLADALASLVLT